ncbi:MAG TPA: transglycosylase domain-containing protein [Pseudonocardia sp.]|nr:transglycosylase domain-containing protein [Pseudonocardia sp.]
MTDQRDPVPNRYRVPPAGGRSPSVPPRQPAGPPQSRPRREQPRSAQDPRVGPLRFEANPNAGREPELLTHDDGLGSAPVSRVGPPPVRRNDPRTPRRPIEDRAGPPRSSAYGPPGARPGATRIDPRVGASAYSPAGGGPGGPAGPPPPGYGGRGGGGDNDGVPPGRSRAETVRRILGWVVGVAVIGPLVAFAIGWMLFDVPTPDSVFDMQVATINYADGNPLAVVRPDGGQNRQKITLAEVPKPVQYAVMSAEDRTFLSNPGFDIKGVLRAVVAQLTGGVGGGSTITQQYIKITTGQDQISLFRKYKEIVLAVKISKSRTKSEILEDYLNAIYFGRSAYGIQAAAQAYFGVDAKNLTPSQGAMLAGMIQSPSRWDPAKNPAKATERWNFVLDGEVAQGWMAARDRDIQRFPEWLPPRPAAGGIPGDAKGHIYTQVKNELESKGITEQELNQEGLKITTTIDPTLQKLASDTAARVLKGQPANLRAALVSVDPRTGAIWAYYGGENGVGLDYAQVLKQPGSSFKPFVMAAALEHSPPIGLGTTYDGTSPKVILGQTVANSDGESCENCSLKTAMTESINTVFYQLAVDVGASNVAKAAHEAGIPSDLLPTPTAGIALGDKEVHPADMASAYATFAADGVYHKPHMVTKVETADGRVLYDEGTDPGEQRIDPQVARNVTESMIDVASSSRIGLADGRAVAAKTGTTQSNIQGQNKDAWTIGYTPSYSTAVWVGTDDNSPIKTSAGRPVYGRMLPGSIWQAFMSGALRGKPKEPFSKLVPLGQPAYDDVPSATEDPNSDSNCDTHKKRKKHDECNSDNNSDSTDCDVVECDDNGDPIRGRRNNGDTTNNFDDNGN